MASMPPTARIHFEMASFTETHLLQDLSRWIIPYADSLGMNEQVSVFLFCFSQVYLHFE